MNEDLTQMTEDLTQIREGLGDIYDVMSEPLSTRGSIVVVLVWMAIIVAVIWVADGVGSKTKKGA